MDNGTETTLYTRFVPALYGTSILMSLDRRLPWSRDRPCDIRICFSLRLQHNYNEVYPRVIHAFQLTTRLRQKIVAFALIGLRSTQGSECLSVNIDDPLHFIGMIGAMFAFPTRNFAMYSAGPLLST